MATGTGIATYVAPSQIVADGTQQQARIVAFEIGDCDGGFMYRKFEWFFPQHGQAFDASTGEDTCHGP
jgi:hypothetical protein